MVKELLLSSGSVQIRFTHQLPNSVLGSGKEYIVQTIFLRTNLKNHLPDHLMVVFNENYQKLYYLCLSSTCITQNHYASKS